MTCVPVTPPPTEGAVVTAARAATGFVLTVMALRAAAEEDPQWWQALAIIAMSPDLLATAVIMTVLAQQKAG